jgi:hypothetical protein
MLAHHVALIPAAALRSSPARGREVRGPPVLLACMPGRLIMGSCMPMLRGGGARAVAACPAVCRGRCMHARAAAATACHSVAWPAYHCGCSSAYRIHSRLTGTGVLVLGCVYALFRCPSRGGRLCTVPPPNTIVFCFLV